MEERIIGRKAIVEIFEKRYGITTWNGARLFIKRHHLPLRRTEAGKPFFYLHEIDRYETLVN